jgi:predicted ATPase
MIESIRIQNYKALRDVTLKLTPIHVLIGKNDSGKTSILQSITALCRSVDYSLNDSFVGRWIGHELVWQHNTEGSIAFQARLADPGFKADYRLDCGFRSGGRNAHLRSEQVLFEGGAYSIGSHESEVTELRRFSRTLKPVPGVPELLPAKLVDLLKGVRTCRWTAGMLSLPVAYEGQVPLFELAPNGFGLPLLLDDILGHNMHRFLELVHQFQRVYPQLDTLKLVREEGFKLPPDDAEGVPRLTPGSGKGIRFDFRDGSKDVPASQVSDGILILLGYLAILFSPEPPRVLLIEEPENGVHPERLVEIIALIREIISKHPRTQVILTTHSPYLVSHFSPEEVTLCHKEPDGSVSLHRLSESEAVKRQSSIFTLGEIWTGEGDDDLARSTITNSPSQEATP